MVEWYSPGGASVHAQLIHASLGLPESKYQTTPRLVQLFLHSSWQRVDILYNGPPPFNLKLPLPMEISWAHPSPQQKKHLDWLSHFCRVNYCHRPTDLTTRLVTIGRFYVRSTAMQPKNIVCARTVNYNNSVIIIVIVFYVKYKDWPMQRLDFYTRNCPAPSAD